MSDVTLYLCRDCDKVSSMPAECIDCGIEMQEVLYVELSELDTLRAQLAAAQVERDELLELYPRVGALERELGSLQAKASGVMKSLEAERDSLAAQLAAVTSAYYVGDDQDLFKVVSNPPAAARELLARVEKLEQAKFELDLANDAIMTVRALLDETGVPPADFLDDHVRNAVAQRNQARAALAAEQQAHGETRRGLESIYSLANALKDATYRKASHWTQCKKGCNDEGGECHEYGFLDMACFQAEHDLFVALKVATTPAPAGGEGE